MADAVKQILKQMRGVGQCRKAKRGRPALDGMRSAKDCVQVFAVRHLQIQAQKALLHLIEQLIGFFKKGLVKLGDIHRVCVSYF